MNEITSRKNNLIKQAHALKGGKGDLFLIEGHHLLEMAYLSSSLKTAFILEKGDPYPGVKTYLVTPEIIDKLSSTPSPEGVVGIAKKVDPKPLSSSRVLVLDRIQDPGNMGTLLRTALSFGFLDVVILEGSASPYGSKAVLSSQGAIFKLNLIQTKKEDLFLILNGYTVLGSSLQNASSLPDFKIPNGKLALVLGNEGSGVDPEILALTSFNLKIPMDGIDSLNVGVAGGILMYELRQKAQ